MCDLPKNNFGQFGSYHENSGLSAPNSSPGDSSPGEKQHKKEPFFCFYSCNGGQMVPVKTSADAVTG